MAVIRNLVVKIGADISGLSKGLKQAQNQMLNISNKLASIGSGLMLKVTLPLMLMAKQALATSGQFEQSMANAASVSNATGEDLQKMTDIARQMGKETVFSASDAADAMYYMASAGYKVDQMANAIQPILNLAAATQNDLAFTTDTVIASLNQFQLESSDAGRVSNVFAAVIGASQATMEKLGYSMNYVGPVANSLGWSIEETAGALGVLYNAGFDGSMAGTSLRQSLVALMTPSAKAKKIFKELNLSLEDLDPTTNSMADIVNRLKDSGMSTAEAMEVFGARAGPGMMALIAQGGDAIANMTEQITGTNSAADMAEKQVNTMQGSAKLMQSMMEEVAITIGDILIPVMRELMEKYVMPLLEKFQGLSGVSKELAVKIGMVAAAIGPAFLILSKLVKVLSVVPKILSVISGPVGIIVAILLVLGAAMYKLYNTNEEFRAQVQKVWSKIQSAIVTVIEVVKDWWEKNAARILETAKKVFSAILDIIGVVVMTVIKIISKVIKTLTKFWKENGKLKDGIKNIWSKILGFIKQAVTGIANFWNEYGAVIIETVVGVFSTIATVIWTAVSTIIELIQIIIEGIQNLWNNNEGFRTAITNIWNAIVRIVTDAIRFIKQFWENYGQAIFDKVKEIFTAIWKVIVAIFGEIGKAVAKFSEYLAPIWEQIKTLFMSLWDVICSLWELLEPLLKVIGGAVMVLLGVVVGVINGIISALGPLLQAVINVVQIIVDLLGFFFDLLRGDTDGAVEHLKSAWDNFKQFWVNLWNGIKNFFVGIWEGICGFFKNFGVDLAQIFKDMWSAVSNWFKKMGEDIANFAKGIWDAITNVFGKIGDWFGNLFKDAFNWGRNLIGNIVDGIKSAIEWVGDTVKSIGQKIKDFLGFSSPTKKGPGSTADEWMPNMMSMMADGIEQGLPDIEGAVNLTANKLSGIGITAGMSLRDDEALFGGMMSALGVMNGNTQTADRPVELSIDGQVFARLILPDITKEYRRNGIVLEGK